MLRVRIMRFIFEVYRKKELFDFGEIFASSFGEALDILLHGKFSYASRVILGYKGTGKIPIEKKITKTSEGKPPLVNIHKYTMKATAGDWTFYIFYWERPVSSKDQVLFIRSRKEAI